MAMGVITPETIKAVWTPENIAKWAKEDKIQKEREDACPKHKWDNDGFAKKCELCDKFEPLSDKQVEINMNRLPAPPMKFYKEKE